MNRTRGKAATRKAKKSYTLSQESVTFLEALRKQRRAASISSVLEEILQIVRTQHKRTTVEEAVAAYYSSLSDKEATEQSQWGDIALREFPSEP